MRKGGALALAAFYALRADRRDDRARAGRTLPPGATALNWAAAIAAMTTDPAAHGMMSDGAAERTASQLNWDNWAAGIAAIDAETVLERLRAAA